MAVAILEDDNNHADPDIKRLKDIGGSHTIYWNGMKLLGKKYMGWNWQK